MRIAAMASISMGTIMAISMTMGMGTMGTMVSIRTIFKCFMKFMFNFFKSLDNLVVKSQVSNHSIMQGLSSWFHLIFHRFQGLTWKFSHERYRETWNFWRPKRNHGKYHVICHKVNLYTKYSNLFEFGIGHLWQLSSGAWNFFTSSLRCLCSSIKTSMVKAVTNSNMIPEQTGWVWKIVSVSLRKQHFSSFLDLKHLVNQHKQNTGNQLMLLQSFA